MNHITLVQTFGLDQLAETEKPKHVKVLFDGPGRKLIEVKLRNGGVLSKHQAAGPITVLCLAGNGIFRAGQDLDETQALIAGSLITLEGGVDHEVVADPDVDLLVTKFDG
ncbi:MAG: hypothetical protein ABIP75_17730 [Pyrinomonadaceae bacterium]